MVLLFIYVTFASGSRRITRTNVINRRNPTTAAVVGIFWIIHTVFNISTVITIKRPIRETHNDARNNQTHYAFAYDSLSTGDLHQVKMRSM